MIKYENEWRERILWLGDNTSDNKNLLTIPEPDNNILHTQII